MNLCLLGSTGSIGKSTLDVVARNSEFSVDSLIAGRRWELLLEQVKQHSPRLAVLEDVVAAEKLAAEVARLGLSTKVEGGTPAILEAASSANTDTVVAAMVGAAGLQPTLAALGAGKRLLLANKESLVMCGDLMLQTAKANGALILPLDSEHNAIFQSLPSSVQTGELNCLEAGVESLILTASGGPFRGMSAEQLHAVSVEQALDHPNWDMGPKVTIDSATLMNKGLEVIEACYLFGMGPDQLEVLVHPQSVIHSMVRYLDGSVVAQMGNPDMRTPIACALSWPRRIASGVESLNFLEAGEFTFEAPDRETFPCLELAFTALRSGGCAPAILNAANEVAVQSYLDKKVGFTQIPQIIQDTLAQVANLPADDLETILAADGQAREFAHTLVAGIN